MDTPKKKLLYLSMHSVLEYDEVSLFTELGFDVFSMGAYTNGGKGHYLLPRPSIEGMNYYPEWEKIDREYPRTNLPADFLNSFDVIVFAHSIEALNENWNKITNKNKVILRTIGQNTSHTENTIRHMWYEGLKIVRMSPLEERIPGYCGSSGSIRFYKNQEEFSNWNGQEKRAITLAQSLKGRRVFCHYDQITQIANGFPFLVVGSGNEDLGSLNGGDLSYDLMKGALRDNRCFIYGGTFPSCYTLSLIEAMMTGIPIVAIGKHLAEDIQAAPEDKYDYYELPDIIRHGENGFISDNINELRNNVHQLLEDEQLAQRISREGRKTALRLFDKEKIKSQWKGFFEVL